MGYDRGRRRGRDKRDGFGEDGFDPFGGGNDGFSPPREFGGGGDRFGAGGLLDRFDDLRRKVVARGNLDLQNQSNQR